ncbi:hypothetical protein LTR70_009142 [Exophiala xenobiotica]|uniref:Uncharacterized protein n=1 Tax=Lithohypha guttulata TaxID=1690604 RepID=A0ABR0K1I7_9EURO|nr:hypothetical protein LTR24_008291 [Lithohypha guttulata]KAK5310924.1 hypothetical protein LTR70_009142 [Exophiala xenobiotica]
MALFTDEPNPAAQQRAAAPPTFSDGISIDLPDDYGPCRHYHDHDYIRDYHGDGKRDANINPNGDGRHSFTPALERRSLTYRFSTHYTPDCSQRLQLQWRWLFSNQSHLPFRA